MKDVLGDIYDGMRLRYVIEEEPLGTAGPVRLATTRACSRSACWC